MRMQFMNKVSIDEVVWSILSGHHGNEIEQQENFFKNNFPELLEEPDFENQTQNYIRLGALAKCAGSKNPVIQILLKSSPLIEHQKKLTFSRFYVSFDVLFRFQNINCDKSFKRCAHDYIKKNENNKKIEKIRELISKNVFDFKNFERMIAWKRNNHAQIIDGTHRTMALCLELGHLASTC